MTAPTDNESLSACADTGLACTGRRAVLRGAAAFGAVGLLAACGGGGGSDTAEPAAPPAAPPAGGSETGGENTAGSNSGGGTVLGPTSDVPVGGGKTYEAQKVIVTQPTAGEYKAFTALCTHEQCVIYQISGGIMTCGCHGSQFSASDGSVQKGPAASPLETKQVTVEGGNLKLA